MSVRGDFKLHFFFMYFKVSPVITLLRSAQQQTSLALLSLWPLPSDPHFSSFPGRLEGLATAE